MVLDHVLDLRRIKHRQQDRIAGACDLRDRRCRSSAHVGEPPALGHVDIVADDVLTAVDQAT